jgi:lactoylglutathione lyase
MIDPRGIYHTGIAVHDLERAKREFEDSLGIVWAPVHLYDPLRLWTPDGWIAVTIRATYSRQGPHHLELIEGEKGSLYDPDMLADPKHIGVWVDEVAREIERLQGLGWSVIASKNARERGYGNMAYMRPPRPGWPVVELVSTELKPMLEAWYAEPDPN